MFIVASFWSTFFNKYGYDTEYRLISFDEDKYLKPLNQIYSTQKELVFTRCAYCHLEQSKKVQLLRCSQCKILFYCNIDHQTKHWKLIHKNFCKKWKKKYKHKKLTQQEIDDLDVTTTLFLSKLYQTHHGPKIEIFQDMLHERGRNEERNQHELLFPDAPIDDKYLNTVNLMMTTIIRAFDEDGDSKLNFMEWRKMWRELGFYSIYDISPFGFYSYHDLFYTISQDIGLIPVYQCSLSNGSFGSYIYPHMDMHSTSSKNYNVLYGPKEIVQSLRFCAYLKSQNKDNQDEDYMDEHDFYDEQISTQKAFKLLYKLYGHAQCVEVCQSQTDIYDIILNTINPYLGKDIVTIIYNYSTSAGCSYIINVSWHRIKWYNLNLDQHGLWNLYNRCNYAKKQYYDIFYLFQTNEKGYTYLSIYIEICDNVTKCDEKLAMLQDGFDRVNELERTNPKQRWCLGQCLSYIPKYSFNIQEHAILIAKVLDFHGLDPKLCHYIYLGVGMNSSMNYKKKVVDAFKKKYNTNTKYRPHQQKRSDYFL